MADLAIVFGILAVWDKVLRIASTPPHKFLVKYRCPVKLNWRGIMGTHKAVMLQCEGRYARTALRCLVRELNRPEISEQNNMRILRPVMVPTGPFEKNVARSPCEPTIACRDELSARPPSMIARPTILIQKCLFSAMITEA